MEIEKLNIGYVRVSTDEQAQNSFSIDFQKERIEEKFKSEGITNFDIMIDDGISGKSLNRPKMKQILELIERVCKEICVSLFNCYYTSQQVVQIDHQPFPDKPYHYF